MLVMGTSAVKVTTELQTGVHETDPAAIAASIERAVARGEYREAVAKSARAYGASIGRLCIAFVGSQAEAEELVQETLLAAYDAFPQFRGEGTVKAFLFGIARRTCARALERRVRRESRLRLVQGGDGAEENATDAAIRKQRADRARAALDELRPTEREALLLRYEADLPFRDVATACGCDEAAARKRVSRALVRMRELLKEEL